MSPHRPSPAHAHRAHAARWSATGAAPLLGLGLMLGLLLSLAWALTGQLIWELAGFGAGACLVWLVARARALDADPPSGVA